MRLIVKTCIVMSLSALLAACGLSSPVKMPQMHTYTLSSVRPVSHATHYRSHASLLVNMPIASPGFDTNHMIYEPLPFNLRHYANHEWAAPPAQMLMPLLAQAIRNQGYFKAVVTVPYAGLSSYLLETQLIALKQSFLKPVSESVLVLQATLVNSNTHRVMASRQFSVIVKAPGNDPYSGVVAANSAVKTLTQQVARWVVHQA